MPNGKEAKAAYMRRWREQNIERAREISRAASARYVKRHPDRFRASQEKYRKKRRKRLRVKNRGEGS